MANRLQQEERQELAGMQGFQQVEQLGRQEHRLQQVELQALLWADLPDLPAFQREVVPVLRERADRREQAANLMPVSQQV